MRTILAISSAVAILALPARSRAEGSVVSEFAPTGATGLAELAALVRARTPGIQSDLLAADLAGADVETSKLLPNPTIDATWGTIPIGDTNPPNLKDALGNVPNYSVGLAVTVPIGKRGPRRARAEALERGANAATDASVRATALSVALTLGDVAGATLRAEGLRSQVTEQRAALVLANSRRGAGFGTPLEVDRLAIELARSEQQVLATEGDLATSIAECSARLRLRCRPFASVTDAKDFLTRWSNLPHAASAPITTRPDIRALDALIAASASDADLARAQAIPDPNVRLGYTHDRFVISGNQMNSLSLSLGFPIPVFDRAQGSVRAADARRDRLTRQRALTIEASALRVDDLRRALAVAEGRRTSIANDALPRARALLVDLQNAANARLIPLTDVIQARRTLNELLVEEADSSVDAFRTSIELLAELPEVTRGS
ncbi:MAG: TolC family protein [Polyangiaceae bacterium]